MEMGKHISGCSCTVKSRLASFQRDRLLTLCWTETILRRKTIQLSRRRRQQQDDDDDNSDWMLVGYIAGLISTGFLQKGGSRSKLSHEHQELYSSRTKKKLKFTKKQSVRPSSLSKKEKKKSLTSGSNRHLLLNKKQTYVHAYKQI